MGDTLLSINPFTHSGSIFSDITPLREPNVVTSAVDGASSGGYVSLVIMILGVVVVAYSFVCYLEAKRGRRFLPFIDRYIASKPQREYFGRKVAKSDLVLTLISFISVLNNVRLKQNVTDAGLVNKVEDKTYFILELMRAERGIEQIDLMNTLDTALIHDKNLILELIRYVENTMVLKVSTIDKTLTTILQGLEGVLTRYKATMSEALEYEININTELKAREIESERFNTELAGRARYTVPEPVQHSDDPFIDAMMRKTLQKEERRLSDDDSGLVPRSALYSMDTPTEGSYSSSSYYYKDTTESSSETSSTSTSSSGSGSSSDSSSSSDSGSYSSCD